MDYYALPWFLKQTILGPGAFYFANTETNPKVHTDFRAPTGRFRCQGTRRGRHGRQRWPRAQLGRLGLHSRLRVLEASFLGDEMGTKMSLEPMSAVWCSRRERVRGPAALCLSWGRYQCPRPPAQADSMDRPVAACGWRGSFLEGPWFFENFFRFSLSCLLD